MGEEHVSVIVLITGAVARRKGSCLLSPSLNVREMEVEMSKRRQRTKKSQAEMAKSSKEPLDQTQ